MKTSKKLFFFFLYFLIFNFFIDVTQIGMAQPPPPGYLEICVVLSWIKVILLVIVIGMIIFSGYQLMTSGGSTSDIEKAKTRLIFALVGGSIIFGANAISKYILGVYCPS